MSSQSQVTPSSSPPPTKIDDFDWQHAKDSVWASIAAGPALCGPPLPTLQPTPQTTEPKCQKRVPSQLQTAEERRAASRKNLEAANLRVQEQALERRAIYEANPKRCDHCAAPLSYKRVTKEGARFCNRSCSGSHNGKIRGPVSPATASKISAGVKKALHDKGWREPSPYTGRQLEVHQRAVASKSFPTSDWPVDQLPYARSFFFEMQRTMQACRVRLYAADVDWEKFFDSPSEVTSMYTGWLVTVESIPSTPSNVLPSINLRISNSPVVPSIQPELQAVVTSALREGYNQDGTLYMQALRRDDGSIALLDYDVIMDDQLIGWRIPHDHNSLWSIDWEPVTTGDFGVSKLASAKTTAYKTFNDNINRLHWLIEDLQPAVCDIRISTSPSVIFRFVEHQVLKSKSTGLPPSHARRLAMLNFTFGVSRTPSTSLFRPYGDWWRVQNEWHVRV